MANKRKVARLKALQFIKAYYIREVLNKNPRLREYQLANIFFYGIKPLQQDLPNGRELFAKFNYISPKMIANPEDLINPKRDSEGNYVSFDNEIYWELSPSEKK